MCIVGLKACQELGHEQYLLADEQLKTGKSQCTSFCLETLAAWKVIVRNITLPADNLYGCPMLSIVDLMPLVWTARGVTINCAPQPERVIKMRPYNRKRGLIVELKRIVDFQTSTMLERRCLEIIMTNFRAYRSSDQSVLPGRLRRVVFANLRTQFSLQPHALYQYCRTLCSRFRSCDDSRLISGLQDCEGSS